MLLILEKLALINFAILININTKTMSFLSINLSKIYLAIVLNQLKVMSIKQIIDVKTNVMIGKDLVSRKVLTQLTLLHKKNMMNSTLFFDSVDPQNLYIETILLKVEPFILLNK